MPKPMQGFTFIELLVVASIIAILAGIALPAYEDYTIRTKIAEALLLTINPRLAIANYYAHYGTLPADNKQAGLLEPNQLRGKYVAAVTVDHGAIHAKIFDGVLPGTSILDFTAVTAPDYPGLLYWNCSSETVKNNYLMNACRTNRP